MPSLKIEIQKNNSPIENIMLSNQNQTRKRVLFPNEQFGQTISMNESVNDGKIYSMYVSKNNALIIIGFLVLICIVNIILS